MRKIRFYIPLLCVVALAGLACGGGDDPNALPTDRPVGAAPPLDLPAPVPATAAYLAFDDDGFSRGAISRVARIDDVAIVVPVRVGTVSVDAPAGRFDARVGATDPLVYRSVAPEVSRDAEFVWTEMESGQVVATLAAAEALELEDRNKIGIGNASFPVGAYADNGVPNVADLMVNEDLGDQLGLGPAQWLVIGANPDADLHALAEPVEEALPGANVAPVLTDPPSVLEPGDPEITGEATGSLIGTMSFRIVENGFIEPDRSWVRENIATAEVAILGEVTCHRLLIPQLDAALAEIAEEGLAGLIRPADYGGCYVPRFIDRDPSNPLSMHAFGLAVDINVSTNLLGTAGDLDPRIVEIFEKWGFEWGGRWERPDPMHFELARLVDPHVP